MTEKERRVLENKVRTYWSEVGQSVVRMMAVMDQLGVKEVGGVKFSKADQASEQSTTAPMPEKPTTKATKKTKKRA